MTSHFEVEHVDLAAVADVLRSTCGPSVVGAIVGRTRLRDEVARHLKCSQLQAETVVDTMIGRGFLVKRERPDSLVDWVIADR